jgi:RHS repeat-associated protein
MYQPVLGRFLSRDPVSPNGVDLLDDNNWFGDRMNEMQHAYAYAGNNPTNYIDPSGLSIIGGTITLPLIRAYCKSLSLLIETRLNNATDREAWKRFVEGTGADRFLSVSEMHSILSLAKDYKKMTDIAVVECEKLAKPTSVQTTSFSVEADLPSPWAIALGRVSIDIKITCKCHCLEIQSRINDRFDFDPQAWGQRKWPNEVKTRLVRLLQQIGDVTACGWRDYTFRGLFVEERGKGC